MNSRELNDLASSQTRLLRIRHGLTQKQAAELAGVSLRHYRKIEAGGRKDIRLATVGKLARAFGLEAWQLIHRESPAPKQLHREHRDPQRSRNRKE